MNASLGSHGTTLPIPLVRCPRSPLLLETKSTAAKLVAAHLLRSESLPKVGRHAELSNCNVQSISLSLNSGGHSVESARRVLCKYNGQLQRRYIGGRKRV